MFVVLETTRSPALVQNVFDHAEGSDTPPASAIAVPVCRTANVQPPRRQDAGWVIAVLEAVRPAWSKLYSESATFCCASAVRASKRDTKMERIL